MITVTYAVLAVVAEIRGLRVYYQRLKGSEGDTTAGYVIVAGDAQLVLTSKISGPTASTFESDMKPWATEVDSPESARLALQGDHAEVYVRQERGSRGHFTPLPLSVTVPAGRTRYVDLTTPDLSNGLDVLSARIYAAQMEVGDEVATAKMLIGQIGAVAADADAGATEITVVGPLAVTQSQKRGGAYDEGLFVSFGADAVTAEQINEADGTGLNPAPELTEHRINRVSAPTSAGEGLGAVVLRLATPLANPIAQGEAVNLVQRWVGVFSDEGLPVDPGYPITIGDATLTAGNVPGSKVIRYGYKNAGMVEKTARAFINALY